MVDVVILIILVIAAAIGYQKGLIRSLLGAVGGMLTLALAYGLARPVAVLLGERLGAVEAISAKVLAIIPLPETLDTAIASINGVAALYSFLEESALPKGLKESILNGVQDQVYALGEGVFMTISEAVARVVAQYIWQGIVFALLWAVLSIGIFGLGRLVTGLIHRLPLIGTLDRVCGALISIMLLAVVLTVLYEALGVLIALNHDQSGLLLAISQSKILPMLQELFHTAID